MKTRYRLLGTAVTVALLAGVLTGTASAGQTAARPIAAPPAVQVKPDGTVVFTAVKRGASPITPNEIIVCSAYPDVPWVNQPNVVATGHVSCTRGIPYISITITLVHYGNWNVTKLYESNPNDSYLEASAVKICLPDRYRTKMTTFVAFPIDYYPPNATRTDNSPDAKVLACGGG